MPEPGLFADVGPFLPFAFIQENGYFKSGMTILTAHFDGKVIVPDSPVKLPVNQPLKVSVSPLAENGAEDDMNEGAWLRAASKNPTFDFLRDEPDLYHSTDGKPFHHAR
jgi:hypothetical protein